MGINAISSSNFFFRLSSASLNTGGNFKAAFDQRNATNLVSKAAQLVADLESIRGADTDASTALSSNAKSFLETVQNSIADIDYDADNGFTLPDLLRGQGIDLQG